MTASPSTVDGLLAEARRRLKAARVEEPGLHARILVGAALGLDAAGLIRSGEGPVRSADVATVLAWVERRAGGEPVGRILGVRSFRGLDFALGPDTLEPRNDTEALVDAAIGAVRAGGVPGLTGGRVAADGEGLLFADVGTGTGAIAIALAHALPASRGIATDLSAGALAVARGNAERHGVGARLGFRQGSWLEPVGERVGLVVSNPPYIPSGDIAELDREVREHDPVLALDGGADGLDAYRAIVPAAAGQLLPGGTLAVEIGWTQAEDVGGLFARAGFGEIRVLPDLAGRDRVVIGRCPGAVGPAKLRPDFRF